MPPIQSQGNRGALITWSVVSCVLFVVATIFSIYFYVSKNEAEDKLATRTKQYSDVLPESALTSQDVAELKAVRQQSGSGYTPNMSIWAVAIKQRDDLAKLVGDSNPVTAKQRGTEALTNAATKLKDTGMTLPTGQNLAGAANTLTDGMLARLGEVSDLNDQLAAAKKQVQDNLKQTQTQMDEVMEQLKAARAEQQAALTNAQTYSADKDEQYARLDKQFADTRAQHQEAINQMQVQVAERDKQIDLLKREVEVLHEKLNYLRVPTDQPIIRQPDGQIVKVPARNVVYINLGSADSITPGLTFEVYDKAAGVPPAGDPKTEENLPVGKASIEVVRVNPTSSECRVTRLSYGAILTEGDLIVNLVYDRNARYNFVVYGDFDMDQNGVATPGDADVIKRLITQWGGKVMDGVTVDTDFVVLGKEPKIEDYSREELEDPFIAKKKADAEKALEDYHRVRQTATDLRIPVLNQNRFLYFIGYFDQAKR